VEPKERGQAEARPRAAAGATSSAARPASTLDAIDPATGEFDMARYLQAPTQTRAGARSAPASPGPGPAPGSLIPTVAAETHVDAVLEADVVEVQAPLHRLVASWDGVEEPIAGKGSETIAKLVVRPATLRYETSLNFHILPSRICWFQNPWCKKGLRSWARAKTVGLSSIRQRRTPC